jgi:Arc/MetJ-type ribon-helix-helix transcriptional regulator
MKESIARRNGGRKPAPARTTRVKIAISLPREQVAAAQRAVSAGRAASVSAYVSRALEAHDNTDSLSELVALMRSEDGPPSADDYAWADAVLASAHGSRKRPKRRAAPR